MTVRELIGDDVIWTSSDTSLRGAAKAMKANSVGSLAVGEDERLIGIITERDLVKACAESAEFDESVVEDWMSRYPDSLSPETSVEDAAMWMAAAGYRHLPIIEGTHVLGVVSIKDILWALTEPTVV